MVLWYFAENGRLSCYRVKGRSESHLVLWERYWICVYISVQPSTHCFLPCILAVQAKPAAEDLGKSLESNAKEASKQVDNMGQQAGKGIRDAGKQVKTDAHCSF